MRIQYKLYTYGPFHIGTGTGVPGQIDDLIVKDEKGSPLIPFSHIQGLVRESMFQLADYLQKSEQICKGQHTIRRGENPSPVEFCSFLGEKPCILCSLTGSPIEQGNVWFSDATLDEMHLQPLAAIDMPGISSDLGLSTHVTINRETGRAEPNKLFTLEVADTSKVFVGEFELIDPSQTDSLDWLLAGLLFTRRIGGRRKRGWGNCRFVIVAAGDLKVRDRLITWIEEVTG